MKVIDNFLPQHDFELVRDYLLNDNFTWYLNDSIAKQKHGLDQYQFVHPFYDISKPFLQNYSDFLTPLFNKLQAKYILRVKANLRPRTTQGVLSPFHTDMDLNQQTAIFYLNTNNGYTKFQDDTFDDVPSVANRLLSFYGGLKHCGSSCTDQNTRVLLNINYIPS
jgi:hypothetical protein